MNSNGTGHLAILASAGSGKTTRLAHRYISLLADQDRQVTPGKICAMTFTRKAAGEIFDKIASELSSSATSPKAADGKTGQRNYLKLLRIFLDNLHRVNIGTMDSFIVSVARAFPLELGIPMDFQVTDAEGSTASENRKAVLAALLAPSAVRRNVQKSFLEAFKLATFGLEEKSFGDVLDRFITSYHAKYRLCPDASRWGDEKKIWPARGRPWKFMPGNLQEYVEKAGIWIEARRAMADKDYGKFLDRLKDVVEALGKYDPKTPWDDAFDSTIGARIIEQLLDSGPENLVIKSGKNDYGIDHDAAKAIEKLVHNAIAIEIDRSLRRTRGIHELLSHYDTAYEEISRQTGRFSFADLQYLLAFGDRTGRGPHISRASGEGDKLYIDYRMDSRLDHWLLDEFQDTSDMQWMIFANLVSELIQGAPDGREKSFFYVGDVKQAIYRWRGGDQDLFLEIYDKYKQVIELETMAKTYRCSPPVIDAVNKIFSTLPGEILPRAAVDKWKLVWEEHETYKKDLPGYVALLEPPHLKENSGIEARFNLVADLLNEIQPLKRGFSVGILVRTNETGSELAGMLRDKCPGMNFVHEGKSGIITNELAQALLSLVKLAAHPGDEFAWKHIRMTPLAEVLAEKKIDRADISNVLLPEIESGGFQQFINSWGKSLSSLVTKKLEKQGEDPGTMERIQKYGAECLSSLVNAASEFDAAGSRNCNRFLTFIKEYEIHEQASITSVRIMTIHQAKGLEFDVVILPELQDGKMNMIKAEPPDLICAGEAFSPEWILKAPKKIVVEHDPELGRQIEKANEDNCFDLLCLVYVAMTRAKHALYMITAHQNPDNSSTFRPSRFIKHQLTGEKEPDAEPNIRISGSPYVQLYPSDTAGGTWYECCKPAGEIKKRKSTTAVKAVKKRPSARTVLRRSEPSRQESFTLDAAKLFDAEHRDVLNFGSAIHELFEKIEWLDEHTDIEKILREWTPSADCREEIHRDVCTQFRNTVKSDDIRKTLARPGGNADVKLEWKFDLILDKKWVSGAFDRVIIRKDSKGLPASAVIIDYKSNRIEPSAFHLKRIAETYRPQMQTYRQALSRILNIPEDRITLQLLLTRIQKIVNIE